MTIEIIPIKIKKDILPKDDLSGLISKNSKLQDGDIIVISQKAVSKQEGRVVELDTVIPSLLAVGIASEYNKDPKIMEIILSESNRIVRMENEIIIVETKNGFICANAGVDESNVEQGYATLLPKNPDESAIRLRNEISKNSKKNITVLISDTFGRPFRNGQTDCAIGVSGMSSILDYAGTKDKYGRTMRVTAIAIVDELCAAAELIKGKHGDCPAAIIRNYAYEQKDDSIKPLIRPAEYDLFR